MFDGWLIGEKAYSSVWRGVCMQCHVDGGPSWNQVVNQEGYVCRVHVGRDCSTGAKN